MEHVGLAVFQRYVLIPYSTYMAETARSSETLRPIYQIRRRHIEDHVGLYESPWEDEVYCSWFPSVYLPEFWGCILRDVLPAYFT
jgi:hypothetical protein